MNPISRRGAGVALAALTFAALANRAAEADRVRERDQLGGAPGWVLPGASLDFDFQNGRYWQGGTSCRSAATCLTVSRASAKYCDDTARVWHQAPANVLCATNKGALIEEARTNSLRNSSMAGAVAGSPGTLPTAWSLGSTAGLTQSIAGTGIAANGINYIDFRYQGTSSGTSIAIFPDLSTQQIAAVQGQFWTHSYFFALVGGTLTNVSSFDADIQEANAAGTVLATTTVNVGLPSATMTRATSGSVTLGQATTAFVRPRILVTIANSASIDFTVRIGWPQIEQCALSTVCAASSPIPTASAAVTRQLDNVTATTNIAGAANGSVTAFVSGSPNMPNNYGITNTALQVDWGVNNQSRLDFDRNANNGIMAPGLAVAGVAQTTPVPATVVNPGDKFKAVFAVAANSQSYAIGGTLSSYDSGNSTFVPAHVMVGEGGIFQHQFNGYVTRVAVWATQRLPSSLVQQLTN
jgi:hypothetical protein